MCLQRHLVVTCCLLHCILRNSWSDERWTSLCKRLLYVSCPFSPCLSRHCPVPPWIPFFLLSAQHLYPHRSQWVATVSWPTAQFTPPDGEAQSQTCQLPKSHLCAQLFRRGPYQNANRTSLAEARQDNSPKLLRASEQSPFPIRRHISAECVRVKNGSIARPIVGPG